MSTEPTTIHPAWCDRRLHFGHSDDKRLHLRDVVNVPGTGGAVSLGLFQCGTFGPYVGVYVRPDDADGDGYMVDVTRVQALELAGALDDALARLRTATTDANGCPSWADPRLHRMTGGHFHHREILTVRTGMGEVSVSIAQDRAGTAVIGVFGYEEDSAFDGSAVDLDAAGAWELRRGLHAAAAALEDGPDPDPSTIPDRNTVREPVTV